MTASRQTSLHEHSVNNLIGGATWHVCPVYRDLLKPASLGRNMAVSNGSCGRNGLLVLLHLCPLNVCSALFANMSASLFFSSETKLGYCYLLAIVHANTYKVTKHSIN